MKKESFGAKSQRGSRYRHWLYALAALLMAASAVFVLIIVTTNRTGRFVKDWLYIAEAYLDVEATSLHARGVISEVVLARNSSHFTEMLSYYTVGEGTYFDVNKQLGEVPDVQGTQSLTLYGVRTVNRPLPYPPQKLWCVYIAYADAPEQVIFLGYHRARKQAAS